MSYLSKLRYVLRFTIIVILLFLLIPSYSSFADSYQWDDNWSYFQELKIPFDTRLEIASFQPIDIKVNFQNPCWAKTAQEHSIRVVCWDGYYWHEIESQIYSLEHNNENFITSCNVVFLVPDFADGNEKYYVFYDDAEKPAPNYYDHVKIEESYYYYEPIPGYPLESNYYKIIDDDYVTYTVSYKGRLMGYDTCQHVIKMKEEIVEVLPKNGELFAAFDFKYCNEEGLFGYSSTSQNLISKDILVDGNLMLEFRIVSNSKLDDLQTTATYKYYHCPTSNSRVHVRVKHKTLKEVEVYSEANTDGTYASLQTGGVKSRSIQDLNIGQILPFMHFFNEIEKISEYKLDVDPEYIPEDPDIRIISIRDDVDLGKNAWISFDEGKTGFSHSIIFSSNNVTVSGNNERDGIQLNAFEMDYPHLPGLENNIATMQVGRNSIETGENHDLVIPEDFIVEFDAEFFSSKTGGFPIIEEEAEIFRELVKIKPRLKEELNDDSDEIEKHDLSVVVHCAPAVPMGSSLSALLGLNLSYISIELYRSDEFIYSKSAVRIPMNAIEELEDPSFLEKIIATLKIFDIKNISIFKKADFTEIEQGKYVIKIFRENPFFSKEKQYIGYAIVDLHKDERIHILCRSEAIIKVIIVDQDNTAVKNAKVILQRDNTAIAKYITNEKGYVTVKVPTSSEAYDFTVIYNGCIIYQEQVKLGFLEQIIPKETTIYIPRYTFNLKVTDTWGQTPEIQLNPVMTVNQADEPIKIYGKKFADDKYIFTNLSQNTYQLSLMFKSFTINQNIEISEDAELELVFPAEYNVKLKILDARGTLYEPSKIVIKRNNKRLEIQNQDYETAATIPPGKYQIEIYDNDELIGKRNIDVYGEQKYDLVTNYQPIYPNLVMISSFLLIVSSSIFFYYKKDKKYICIIFVILLMASIFLPWWEINGSTEQVQASTKLYVIPNNMITRISTENTIAGELSYLPIEFQNAITLMIIITIIGCTLLILNQISKNTEKKRLNQISKIFAILLLLGTLLIFIIAQNEVCRFSIGSFIGNGYLEIGVPGEGQIYLILSNWGPSIGFYLYLISITILFFDTLFKILKGSNKKMNCKNK